MQIRPNDSTASADQVRAVVENLRDFAEYIEAGGVVPSVVLERAGLASEAIKWLYKNDDRLASSSDFIEAAVFNLALLNTDHREVFRRAGESLPAIDDPKVFASLSKQFKSLADRIDRLIGVPTPSPILVPQPAGVAKANDLMKAELAANLDLVKGFTLRQWAAHIGRSKSACQETETWKSLSLLRNQARAEKRKDRARK